MKKIKKLIKNPGIFFRDYLNKKYPVINNEQMLVEAHESLLIESDFKLLTLESYIRKEPKPIDVVFTWVDNKDPQWLAKYQQANQQPDILEKAALYSNDTARFTNHNELYYSVYSVQKFMPWVRRIFIVTDAQIPPLLKEKNFENITVIDHKEIIDHHFLPTFNSHVIEANLHKIPGLSEDFIYFNDDVFVARELMPEHFFRQNGVASIFIAAKKLKIMQEKGIMTPTLWASLNSIRLLQRRHDTSINMPLVHTYVPLKKSMYQLAWALYEPEINAFLPNKLRTNEDLNMATFLVPWLMYLEGKSVLTREICYYFNIRSANAPAQYAKLLRKNHTGEQPHSFCADDFNSKSNIPNYQSKLISMLQDYYDIWKLLIGK